MREGREGVIAEFKGSWASGLAHLTFEDGTVVPCENASTVRALEAAFGNVIREDHTLYNGAIRGKRIRYFVDAVGVLASFEPL